MMNINRSILILFFLFFSINGFLLWVIFRYTKLGLSFLIIGAIFLGLFYFLSRNKLKRFWSNFLVRKQIYNFLLATILLLFLVSLNLFISHHTRRIDLTSFKQFSLSEESKKLLSTITVPINIIGYFRVEQEKQFKDLVSAYNENNRLIEYEIKRPDLHPDELRELKIPPTGGIALKMGDKSIVVDKLFEDHLTGGLRALLQDKPPEICILGGIGGSEIFEQGGEGNSVAASALATRGNMLTIIPIEKPIPLTCNVFFIQATKAILSQNQISNIVKAIEENCFCCLNEKYIA